MNFFSDIYKYIKVSKKYWLIPIFFVLIVFGGLLFVAQNSVVAPFIYTIF